MSDTLTPQSNSGFIKNVTNPNLAAAAVPEQQPQAQAQTPPQAQVQPKPQVQPQQAPPAAPNQQNVWDAYAAQQRMLELERINREQQNQLQQMQAQYAEQSNTIDNLLKAQQEYDQLKAAQAAHNFDYSKLTTIAPEDAKVITDNIIHAVQAQIDPLKKRIGEQDQQMQATATYQEQRFQQQQAANTLNQILKKHPDFMSLRNNPDYVNYLRQRDGYSSYTIDQRAAMEFQLGNADYINHMLDDFKSRQPNVNTINSVAPVQTSNQTVAPATPPAQLPTLQELNSMMQMRQITPERYRELLKQIRNEV